MREVEYKKWVKTEDNQNGGKGEYQIFTGTFHNFAQDNEDGMPCPTAIVEQADGTVISCSVSLIRFIGPNYDDIAVVIDKSPTPTIERSDRSTLDSRVREDITGLYRKNHLYENANNRNQFISDIDRMPASELLQHISYCLEV